MVARGDVIAMGGAGSSLEASEIDEEMGIGNAHVPIATVHCVE